MKMYGVYKVFLKIIVERLRVLNSKNYLSISEPPHPRGFSLVSIVLKFNNSLQESFP